MIGLLNCIIYLILSGVLVFFIGRIIPRKWIKENKFPFKSYRFEKNGKIYEKLRIKKWKLKILDASVVLHKIIPKLIPTKRLEKKQKEKIPTLIKESCVAETTHALSAVLGLFCIKIWKKWGWIVSVVYFIWNIPYILIQRYNRPRLMAVMSRA